MGDDEYIGKICGSKLYRRNWKIPWKIDKDICYDKRGLKTCSILKRVFKESKNQEKLEMKN